MARKRILLMYITEISGHHSATLAIEQAIKKLSADTEILNINGFNYTNPIAEKIVGRLYMTVIKRTPKVWDYLYDNPSILKRIKRIKDAIHRLNSPKFHSLFHDFKPDIVACSQAYPCGMVADYKKTYRCNTPLVAILTDFVPHSYWIYDTINYYVSPSDEVTRRLAEKGIPLDKIKTFGIPFDPKFNEPVDKKIAAARHNLKPHYGTLLIMGGGHGLGPIEKILKSLDRVQGDFQEIVVTGSNRKLYHSLKKKIKRYKKHIALLGYANNINELMSIADVIITKPGGITTSEAMAKQLPMIIVNPLPGQEASNTVYLTEKGAAIEVDNPAEISFIVENLLNDPGQLRCLREAAAGIAKPNASMDIARFLLDSASS
ncbi:MAG: glycosyltransferase [Candidatus Omnitrophica bacterium]|nr:glycosyltransferase [Candidatus Omnitrophota bacterium]